MKNGLLFTFTGIPVLLVDLDFKSITIKDEVAHSSLELIAKGEIDVKGFELLKNNRVGYSVITDRFYVNNISLLEEGQEFLYQVFTYDGDHPSSKDILKAANLLQEEEKALMEGRVNSFKVTSSPVKDLNESFNNTFKSVNPFTFYFNDDTVKSIVLEVFELNLDQGDPLAGKILFTISALTDSNADGKLMTRMTSHSDEKFYAFVYDDHNEKFEATVEIQKKHKDVALRNLTYVVDKTESTLEEHTNMILDMVIDAGVTLGMTPWRNDHWL